MCVSQVQWQGWQQPWVTIKFPTQLAKKLSKKLLDWTGLWNLDDDYGCFVCSRWCQVWPVVTGQPENAFIFSDCFRKISVHKVSVERRPSSVSVSSVTVDVDSCASSPGIPRRFWSLNTKPTERYFDPRPPHWLTWYSHTHKHTHIYSILKDYRRRVEFKC